MSQIPYSYWQEFLREHGWTFHPPTRGGDPKPIGDFIDQAMGPHTDHWTKGDRKLWVTIDSSWHVVTVVDARGKIWTLAEAKAATLRRRAGQSEGQISDWLQSELNPHFSIETEVEGRAIDGRTVYIDLMLRPIEADQWADPKVALGVEIKRKSRETGDCCRHFGQSVDYAMTKFNKYGYVHVLTYPDCIPEEVLAHQYSATLFPRLLGRVGVGSIHENDRHGLLFVVNGHRIWSQRYGVMEAKRWKLKRKFGSR